VTPATPLVEILEPHVNLANVPTSTPLLLPELALPTQIAHLPQFVLVLNALHLLETADLQTVVNSKHADAQQITREPFALINTISAPPNGPHMPLA